MLRMALIFSLILLNLSVWVGPAEVIAVRTRALLDARPQYERAQACVLDGDFKSAVAEYQALIQVEPENPLYRSELGLLCFNNGEAIQEQLGWSRDKTLWMVVENFRAARDLTPGDYSAAALYAMTLMDENFFGNDLPLDVVLEAWKQTLATVRLKQDQGDTWNQIDMAAAHAFLQLARAEYRYGRKIEMQQYLDLALAENPRIRIPEELRAS